MPNHTARKWGSQDLLPARQSVRLLGPSFPTAPSSLCDVWASATCVQSHLPPPSLWFLKYPPFTSSNLFHTYTGVQEGYENYIDTCQRARKFAAGIETEVKAQGCTCFPPRFVYVQHFPGMHSLEKTEELEREILKFLSNDSHLLPWCCLHVSPTTGLYVYPQEQDAGMVPWTWPLLSLAAAEALKPSTLDTPPRNTTQGSIGAFCSGAGWLSGSYTTQEQNKLPQRMAVMSRAAWEPWADMAGGQGLTPTCWLRLSQGCGKLSAEGRSQSLIYLHLALDLLSGPASVPTARLDHLVGRINNSHVELETPLPAGLQSLSGTFCTQESCQ